MDESNLNYEISVDEETFEPYDDIDEFSDSNQNSDFVEELDSSDEKISLLACENLNY